MEHIERKAGYYQIRMELIRWKLLMIKIDFAQLKLLMIIYMCTHIYVEVELPSSSKIFGREAMHGRSNKLLNESSLGRPGAGTGGASTSTSSTLSSPNKLFKDSTLFSSHSSSNKSIECLEKSSLAKIWEMFCSITSS